MGCARTSHPGRDWLSSIEHWKTPASPVKIASFAYSRVNGTTKDLTGRILKETDHLNQVHSFSYDVHGRLTGETDPAFGTRTFWYDARGNRTQQRTVQSGATTDRYYGYNWLNQLTWANVNNNAPGASPTGYYQKWTYDAVGRVTLRERRLGGTTQPKQFHQFWWDQMDKLRQVQYRQNSGSYSTVWSATYDGDGLRATKTDGSGVHGYDSDGGSILRETLNGVAGTTYTPGLSQRSSTGADRFFHQDWLGSSRYVTDGSATTASAADWSAYGRKEASTGEAYSSDFQWGGGWGYQQDPDANLGLTLMGQRYYDPEVGRFISEDPVGFAGGINLYGYCGGDPVGGVDPLGLWKTGSYAGDVGEVFKGYGDSLNPVNWYHGAVGLYQIGRTKGLGAAAGAFGNGLLKTFQGLGSDDPRVFGNSTMTVMLIAAPIAKKLPIKVPAPVQALARSVEAYAVAPAAAAIASRGGALGAGSLGCGEMARSMSGILQKVGVPHEVLYTRFPQARWVTPGGDVLTESGAHFSIRVGGRVFDTATGPLGKPFSAWPDVIGARGSGVMEVRPGGSPGAFGMPNPFKGQ